MVVARISPTTLKLSNFARVAPQQGSLSPRALDKPIDSCEAGLPCTVMFDQAADMLECQTQPREQPDQGTLITAQIYWISCSRQISSAPRNRPIVMYRSSRRSSGSVQPRRNAFETANRDISAVCEGGS